MATQKEVQTALLDRILDKSESASTSDLLRLAEAFAWVVSPMQPHGGNE